MADDKPSKVDDLLNRIRNHRLLSILIVLGTIVIGLGAVTSAIENISNFLFDTSQPVAPTVIDGRDTPGSKVVSISPIKMITEQLTSDDALVRRMGVLALKDHPDQAVSLLITSSILGAIDSKTTREDTTFTSVVKETLVDVGPPSIKPLITEWRRARDEIRSRFEIYPNEEADSILGFLKNSLGSNFPISADSMLLRAREAGSVPRDNSAAQKTLTETETLELYATQRNILKIIATLLRNYLVADLDLSGLEIRGDFSEVNLQGADLSGCDLLQVNFSGSNFSGANLHRANLNLTNLSRANLSNANLTELSTGDGADFSGADLDNVNFSRSRAISANFKNASLSHANFNETILNRSNFSGANFKGTLITNALLRNATLADVRGFEDIADMYLVNLRDSIGLTESQRQSATNRGAVWDDTVATRVERLPASIEFPSNLKKLIRYQIDKNVLIWSGGRMDRKDYIQLREIDLGTGNQNAIFYLERLSLYLN